MIIAQSVINFFHMSSTAIWIGSIILISLILRPIFKNLEGDRLEKILESIFRVFRILSIVCVILIILSGILLTSQKETSEISLSGIYGIIFLIKHIIILIIIAIIFTSKLYIFPKIKNLCVHKSKENLLCKYKKNLCIAMYVSSALGVITFFLTALMQSI